MRRVVIGSIAGIAAVSIAAIFTPANAATTTQKSIAGTTCTKAGSTKTVGSIKYTCIKSGKKLIWNKGVAIKPAIDPKVAATLGARMANVIEVQAIADKIFKNSQGLQVEEPTNKLAKTTNPSVKAQVATAKLARQMIMSFSPMFPNFDMSDLKSESYRSTNLDFNAAHGVFHLTQDWFARTAGGYDPSLMPSWYREGTAMVFAGMATAEANKNNPNYALLAASNNNDWSKEKCQARFEKWRSSTNSDSADNTCEFGLGQILAEVLIARDGSLDKIATIEQFLATGNSFDEAFRFAYNETREDFFKDMDAYLSSLNW